MLPEGVVNFPGPNEALTFSIDQGTAIVYGAGVDNSMQGLTFQIAWPSSD